MTLRIRQVVIDTTDVRASAELRRRLLDLSYRPGHEPPPPGGEPDSAGRDWLNLQTAYGAPCLAFQQVAHLDRSTWPEWGIPQQLLLDPRVAGRGERDAVHRRVLGLGDALRLDHSTDPDEPLRVNAEPDSHPFRVFVAAG